MTDINNLTPLNINPNPNYSQINNLLLDNKNKAKPELKRSFTEAENFDMNLEDELRDLKKVIETQKKKNIPTGKTTNQYNKKRVTA